MNNLHLTTLILFLSSPLYADIQTDGSIGVGATLSGPNFEIGSSLGEQQGGNLFHSFNEFSLSSGEVANFSGPASVDNIIGRVTGDSISSLNGTIRSSIEGADLYLINPNGVIFGKDAQLDLKGSFSVTTANNIKFTDGSSFGTSLSDVSLTMAPLESFGFLSDSPNSIQSLAESLTVSSGNDINLVGGDIDISIDRNGRNGIKANNGSINIISTAGESTINIDTPTLGNQEGGVIHLHGSSRISTNTIDTVNAGNITIQGNSVIISDKAKINSDTAGLGNAGSISIKSYDFEMYGVTDLSTSTFGSGNAGLIELDFSNGVMRDDAFINSTSYIGSGSAGSININASKSLVLVNNATIKSTVHTGAAGDGGNVNISTSLFSMTGDGDTDNDGNLSEDSALISSNVLSNTTGKGGNVNIKAETINISNGATIAVASGGAGNAGDIDLIASSKINTSAGFISSEAATGSGGNITIEGPPIIDLNSSRITASVKGGTGNGGNVNIFDVGGIALQNSHITANSEGAFGGRIYLDASLVRDPLSTTTARGINVAFDGEVFITDEINPNNVLNDLRLDLLINQIKSPCSIVIANEESSLTIKKLNHRNDCN